MTQPVAHMHLCMSCRAQTSARSCGAVLKHHCEHTATGVKSCEADKEPPNSHHKHHMPSSAVTQCAVGSGAILTVAPKVKGTFQDRRAPAARATAGPCTAGPPARGPPRPRARPAWRGSPASPAPTPAAQRAARVRRWWCWAGRARDPPRSPHRLVLCEVEQGRSTQAATEITALTTCRAETLRAVARAGGLDKAHNPRHKAVA